MTSPAGATRPPVARASTKALASAALGLVVVVGLLALAILSSQRGARSRLVSNFRLRGTTSATFVSTYLSQEEAREMHTASRYLSARRVSPTRFNVVVSTLGSEAAVLLDSAGRVLNVVPSSPSLVGKRIAARYAHLTSALHGRPTVSNLVPSVARGKPVAAVAVPFSTPAGRRVFSVAYPDAGPALTAFVGHTISYRRHEVFLVDANGQVIASSPDTPRAANIIQADPALARAALHASSGPVPGARQPTTFTMARVPGTAWWLLIAVPNSRLYASAAGWGEYVSWIVFALVSVLGAALVAMLARSHADRTRLRTLSDTLEQTARTDALTGLLNRRALTDELTRAAAHARRRGEPLSVLMIDLDRFKETNDCFGHEAGDRVLCALADCMRDTLRSEDSYGRWGGDEFLVTLPGDDEGEARIVADRLLAGAARVDLSDIGLEAGVPMSVGTATAATAQVTPDEIVRMADLDLYRVKSERAQSCRRAELESNGRAEDPHHALATDPSA